MGQSVALPATTVSLSLGTLPPLLIPRVLDVEWHEKAVVKEFRFAKTRRLLQSRTRSLLQDLNGLHKFPRYVHYSDLRDVDMLPFACQGLHVHGALVWHDLFDL